MTSDGQDHLNSVIHAFIHSLLKVVVFRVTRNYILLNRNQLIRINLKFPFVRNQKQNRKRENPTPQELLISIMDCVAV